MEALEIINVTYKSTKSALIANQYLSEISKYPIIAADFEVATRYTPAERAAMQAELDSNPPKSRRIQLESTLAATALDHPSHCTITHCSVAVSDRESYVFILDNASITNLVLNFLVTTPIKQVWHRASFDFRHIYYHTGKFPLDYEDSQVFAKTLLNHVDTYKANTGLKDLGGRWYGAWAISSDSFDLSKIYDPTVLLYSAIDACCTFKLYHELLLYVERSKETLMATGV